MTIKGKPYTVRYEAVNAMLLNEFLKEHRKTQELEATIAKQQKDFQATVAHQQKQIEALTAGLQKVSAQLEAEQIRTANGSEQSVKRRDCMLFPRQQPIRFEKLRKFLIRTGSTRQKQKPSMKTECTSRIAFFNPRGLTRFALYAVGLVFASASMSSAVAGDNAAAELSQSVPAHAPGKWKATGDLGTARFSHTATLLLNGQLLVTGGIGSDGLTVLASAELYDPATGVWTATGSMTTPRESTRQRCCRMGRCWWLMG